MKLNKSEYEEQKELVMILRYHCILFCAVPNAAKRSPALANMLKASGMSAGVPDILIFEPITDPLVRGIAIEMKSEKGRASEEQINWLAALERAGWVTRICYGCDEAIDFLRLLGFKL